MSLNQIIVMGHLGGDPELSYTPAGTAKCTFSVATSRKWTDKESNEKKEETTWHNCLAWGKRAEVIKEYFQKGDMILVVGEQQHRTYIKEGETEKKFWSQINIQNFSFCGKASGGGKPQEPNGVNDEAPAQNSRPGDEDDLPF